MNEINIKKKDKVHSFRGHFLYSLGAIPSALPFNMIQGMMLTFLTLFAGLSLELYGILLIIYGIWNAINDPLIGYYMDKIKTKWGRRVPWIVIGIIPFTIGFIFLWWIPYTEEILVFFHALIMLFLFDIGFTMTMTAWSALYTEMYEDEKERASIVAGKDTIAFISSMIGIILPLMIADAIGWPLTGLIFGITIPITMLLSLLGIKERKEYQIDEPLPIIAAFKETFSNKPFLIVTMTYAMLDFCFALTMSILPLYAIFILKMEVGMAGFSAIGVALGILASVPFWWKIYEKKGPKYGLALSMGIFCIGMIPLFLAEDFLSLTILALLPGFGAGGMLMTEPAISAAIDYDELRIGKRREATYTGIMAFMARLSIVFSGFTLIIVKILTGFDPSNDYQSATALIGLRLTISIVPAICILIGLLIFKFFPINYKAFCEQQEKLKILHEQRLKKLEGIK